MASPVPRVAGRENEDGSMVEVQFVGARAWSVGAPGQLVVSGTRANLLRADALDALPPEARAAWPDMVASLNPGDTIAATTTWVSLPGENNAGKSVKVHALAISERASRHNAKCRPDALAAGLKGRLGKGEARLVLVLSRAADLLALAAAVGRAFPLYHHKGKAPEALRLEVVVLAPSGAHGDGVDEATLAEATALCEAVRDAARLTDMPPSELHTDAFVAECELFAEQSGLGVTVLRAAELANRGMGGLVGVGQAARREPALVHLRWDPPGATGEPMAWVGKGIVFDTGGLSIKGKTDMPGMKVDMGGAAAVFAGFKLAVARKVPRRIDAILCLAENSVGPDAIRPDDIITLYSGKTIEVNNTDAEGRLVLADGVAFAVKDCDARMIVDLATLTGAQLMATGKLHAAIVSNDEALEDLAIDAGQRSGDLCFPLPFAPELFRGEFSSPVADLRNSVKDRMNAQSSCAAQFIAESLAAVTPDGVAVKWLHVDMAGPVVSRDRATGYGVALLFALATGAPTQEG